MFSSKNKRPTGLTLLSTSAPASAALPRPSGVPSIIAADMTIRGNLKSLGDLHVEGCVLGDIEVGRLVIADGATVQGEIIADRVDVCGTLTGLIRAREVTLKATARVVGDIFHDVLAIEAGGQLEGQCRRLSAAVTEMAVVAPKLVETEVVGD